VTVLFPIAVLSCHTYAIGGKQEVSFGLHFCSFLNYILPQTDTMHLLTSVAPYLLHVSCSDRALNELV